MNEGFSSGVSERGEMWWIKAVKVDLVMFRIWGSSDGVGSNV